MSTLRRFAMPLAFIAAGILIYMVNPWITPPPEINGALTLPANIARAAAPFGAART